MGPRRITEAQLADLFRCYGPMLLVRAKRIVGDDADDVVQEVFLRLMKSPPEHEELKAWLYRTCTNLCITNMRYRARRKDDWQRDVKAIVESRKIGDVEALLVDKDLVLKVMSRMDEKAQQVAILVFIDEMSMQDAADTLRVTRKTVYNRLEAFRSKAGKVLAR